MQIHVVSAGQTVYSIAQAYNTTAQQIISANQLRAPNDLVVGQALVIPIVGRFYYVQSGDSLWSIGRKYGISPQELARINNISVDSPLTVGLRLYIPPLPKKNAEFLAYVEPQGASVSPTLERSAREAAPHLTYLAIFSFQAQRDGSLREPLLNNFATIASSQRTGLVMVISNQESGEFSADLARIILNDMMVQDAFLKNIEETARKYGFSDIHFDFEHMRPEDRDAYTAFLKKAKTRFSKQGWLVSIALAPKTSATQKGTWFAAFDYKAQGAAVDFVLIMTYEWGYSGGPAQAVSPIGPVRKVLNYAISEIPANKVMMGQNLYGYDWTLPFRPGTIARAISPQTAIDLARQFKVPIQYDTVAQAPFFRYRDESGNEHEVWFEDARSIQAKFDLLKELNLRGMGYWKLGLSFPQNWLLIQENFNVEKKG
ncbi:LysM peptidoglycan-binding domain-containing protein [Bacillus testis]|uniref:LysM peptidoglycan-binding domain-containing protein n=1 Tax=Bacillus testis TaxID=1622072 RepID=UPI00067EF904|nr:glycoside hydrolase family 18 protein [Bacillus testis]